MTKHPPNAEFATSLPDDAVEDENDIVIFPGRNIAEAIAGILLKLGYEVGEPEHCFELGWEFTARSGRRRYWFRIARVSDDECYLHTVNMTLWLWPERRRYEELLGHLDRALRHDQRFSRIQWFYKR